ncbi:hypothetical protein PR202_gb27361 [Eleusine coracana subsp. coracana]|uniref:3'-5' exonuclease domain-containing protein n=1 Tax=Eleusine coracana subsp. coracana TaxID=191504 RepID=A0AAV5FU92_ELECO|nr:hypothetical protein PR202_gb27361 [Eleusine coracana subsp. coracana]
MTVGPSHLVEALLRRRAHRRPEPTVHPAVIATVPDVLRHFLADNRVRFAGCGVAADCQKLRVQHGVDVASTMELRGVDESKEDMAARHLGLKRIEMMPEKVRTASKWDGATLSKMQIRYACTDAYLSRRLAVHLRDNGEKAA